MDKNTQEILSQNFTYLGEGLQAVVFQSPDKKFILKLFKTFDEAKEQYKKWGKNSNELKEAWFDNGDKSYKLAIEKLSKETGVLYVHLDNELVPVKILKADNKEFDVSKTKFLLQGRVELVCDRLKKLMSENKITESEKVIDDVIEFISSVWKKNITEDTFNWDHNYGYTESDRLVQIDTGSFWEGKEFVQKEIFEKKLLNSDSAKWLKENFPELIDYYNRAVANLYQSFEEFS